MTSIYTQGRLGLSHGLTLERLHCTIRSREGCCDLASFITEGSLVCQDLCGVLAGEHCWRKEIGCEEQDNMIHVNILGSIHCLRRMIFNTFQFCSALNQLVYPIAYTSAWLILATNFSFLHIYWYCCNHILQYRNVKYIFTIDPFGCSPSTP